MVEGLLGAFRIRARLTNVPDGAFALQVRYCDLAPRWDNSEVVVGQLFSNAGGDDSEIGLQVAAQMRCSECRSS
jgi:hypothetical protein